MQPSGNVPMPEDASSRPTSASAPSLCERWRRGEAPLAELLARAAELGPLELVEVLTTEQYKRWRQGDRISAAEYLERYPQLAADPMAACELVYSEFRLRGDLGEPAALREYIERFPDLAELLRRKDQYQASYLPGPTTLIGSPFGESTPGPSSAGHPLAGGLPRVPDYELHQHIGAGGFGHVWLARNRHDQGLCAVKVVARSRQVELAGLRVYRQCAGDHPGLVPIKHIGEGEGFYYYVMPLADDVSAGALSQLPQQYEAMTLSRCLARRSLTLEEILSIARSLLSALNHLQQRSVSHCDVKPDNILLVQGRWQLGDLGLASRIDEVRPGRGTLAYWPPEGPCDQTADLYALGKTLYLMLTGAPLEQFPEFAAGRLKAAQGGRHVEGLRQLILRACQADPAKRYASAAAMRQELDRFYPEGSPRRRRRLLGALTALALVSVPALVVFFGVGGLRLLEHDKIVGNGPNGTPGVPEDLSKARAARIGELSRETGLHLRQGRFLELLKAHQEILDIQAREFGPGDERTIEAQAAVRAFERLVRLPAQEQRAVARTYSQDEEVHRCAEEGRLIEAIQKQREIYAVRERYFDPDSITLASTKIYLARLLQEANEEAEAERLHLELLKTLEHAGAKQHPETAAVCNNLATIYWNRKDYPRAERLLAEARTIRLNRLQPGAELRVRSALRLAMLLDDQGRSEEAKAYYEEARQQADLHPVKLVNEADAFEGLADQLERRNHQSEAAFYRAKAAEIRRWWGGR
jgi:hypothetical protein